MTLPGVPPAPGPAGPDPAAGPEAKARPDAAQDSARRDQGEAFGLLWPLFQTTADCIQILEASGRVLMCNPAAARLSGVSPQECRGREAFSGLAPDLAAPRRAAVGQVLRSGLPADLDDVQDGRSFRHHFYPLPGEQGQGLRVAVVSRDLTEQRAMGEAHVDGRGRATRFLGVMLDQTETMDIRERLRESEERFRLLAENIPDTVFHMRLSDGSYGYVSPAVETLTGYAPEEYYARPFLVEEIIHPEFREYLYVKWADLKAGVVEPSYEFMIVNRQGQTRWVSQRLALIRDAQGRPEALDGILTDITARKEAEARLRASLREKEVLLREVHHRVKNNLQIVSGLLEMSGRRHLGGGGREFCEAAQSRIQGMALIHNLLYRGEACDRVDMAAFARELFRQTQALFAWRDLAVDPGFSFGEAVLPLDLAVPCGLALGEVITNVFKHAHSGGGQVRLHLAMGREDGDFFVEARDDGRGFPPDLNPEAVPTLGLKLLTAIVREQLRGEVRLESRDGALVRFRFPVGMDAEP